jgi:hypothetical protein
MIQAVMLAALLLAGYVGDGWGSVSPESGYLAMDGDTVCAFGWSPTDSGYVVRPCEIIDSDPNGMPLYGRTDSVVVPAGHEVMIFSHLMGYGGRRNFGGCVHRSDGCVRFVALVDTTGAELLPQRAWRASLEDVRIQELDPRRLLCRRVPPLPLSCHDPLKGLNAVAFGVTEDRTSWHSGRLQAQSMIDSALSALGVAVDPSAAAVLRWRVSARHVRMPYREFRENVWIWSVSSGLWESVAPVARKWGETTGLVWQPRDHPTIGYAKSESEALAAVRNAITQDLEALAVSWKHANRNYE